MEKKRSGKSKKPSLDDGGAVEEFTKVAEDLRDAMEITSHLELDNIEPIMQMIEFLKQPELLSQVTRYSANEMTAANTSY